MVPNMYMQQSGVLNRVHGIEGANSFIVAPNNAVTLWDTEQPTIYLKSADAFGVPSMRILDYTERQTPTKAVDTGKTDYVTRDDILSIQKEIDAIKAKLEPKKTTKKEVTENE